MNTNSIKQLIELNNAFYKQTAPFFNQTRSYNWKGWDELLQATKNLLPKPASILDVGCGNGRFAGFLKQGLSNFDYLGIDNNKQLLEIAQDSFPHAQIKFKLADIFSYTPEQKYDLITVFGVMHHIPGVEARSKFLERYTQALTEEGILAFSTWNFAEEERYQKRFVDPQTAGLENIELGKGDFILDWQKGTHAYRYCHYYTEAEVLAILKELNLKLISNYRADGKTGKLNSYYLAQLA